MTRETQLAQEIITPDEKRWTDKLISHALQHIDTIYTQPMKRDAHAKQHGIIKAQFSVLPNLPEHLRVGLFAKPKTYDAWIRLSNFQDFKPDSTPDFRGMGIKLLNVPGDKLLYGQADSPTHDLLLLSHDVFMSDKISQFYWVTLAATSKNPLAILSYLLRGLGMQPRYWRNFIQSQQKHAHLLAIHWNSINPFLLGEGQAVKYAVRPSKPFTPQMPAAPTPDFLRERLADTLSHPDGFDLDFFVQVQKDPAKQPVERYSVRWEEADTPFIRVASIHLPQQKFTSAAQDQFGMDSSFSPWRCLPEHRPLGQLTRSRDAVYGQVAKFRHERNHVTPQEPTEWVDFN